MLAYPDYNNVFKLKMDASMSTLGAILTSEMTVAIAAASLLPVILSTQMTKKLSEIKIASN